MDIRPLDPADQAAAEGCYEMNCLADAVDIPDLPVRCRQGHFAGLSHPWPGEDSETLVAWVDGRVVANAEIDLPMVDNLDNAQIAFRVRPDYRRRGIGTALLERAKDLARTRGRRRIMGNTVESIDGGAPRDPAGRAFAERAGAATLGTEIRRRLTLVDVDPVAHAELLTEAWRHAEGYRLTSWHGSIPEEHLERAAYLDGRLLLDAPLGDVEWEPHQMNGTRLRAIEQAVKARGRRLYNTGAVHEATGEFVAFTAISMDASWPDHAWQIITIVDPEHRGRRLGLIIKLANLARIRREEPEVAVVDTWNSVGNDHMIAINEAMGYRPVDRTANWQLAI